MPHLFVSGCWLRIRARLKQKTVSLWTKSRLWLTQGNPIDRKSSLGGSQMRWSRHMHGSRSSSNLCNQGTQSSSLSFLSHPMYTCSTVEPFGTDWGLSGVKVDQVFPSSKQQLIGIPGLPGMNVSCPLCLVRASESTRV